jgi:diacylglycerol kinase family enzyme
MNPWLLVNPSSGDGCAERVGLVDAARGLGIEVHVLSEGENTTDLARAAVDDGADAIGAASGDGSLGPLAAVAVERDVPFVCIPAGTRNHFALDLGLDRDDPLAALAAFTGTERRIDVGMVGDRMFLNNVSLGAYAKAVAEPDYRERKLTASRRIMRRLRKGEEPGAPVTFTDPDGHVFRNVPVLFVGNNCYEVGSGPGLLSRDGLDRGILQVSVLRAVTRVGVVRAVVRVILRRPTTTADWAQWETSSLHVDSAEDVLPVAIDGESIELAPPLEFRLRRGALRVLVPRL